MAELRLSSRQTDVIKKLVDAAASGNAGATLAPGAADAIVAKIVSGAPAELRSIPAAQLKGLISAGLVKRLGSGGTALGAAGTVSGAQLNQRSAGADAKSFVETAKTEVARLEATLGDVRGLITTNQQARATLTQRGDATLAHLVDKLLPNVGAAVVKRAMALTGADLVAFCDERPPVDVAALKLQLAGHEQDLTTLRPLREEYDALVECKYGTRDYTKGFLNPSRFLDPGRADEILGHFPGVADFRELVAKIDTARTQRDSLQKLLAGRPSLTDAKAALTAHIRSADGPSLLTTLGSGPEQKAFVDVTALNAQLVYLDDVLTKKLMPLEMSLTTDLANVRSAASGKVPQDPKQLALASTKLTARSQAYRESVKSTTQAQTRIVEYRPPQTVYVNSGPSVFEMYFWWNVMMPHHHDHGGGVTNNTTVNNFPAGGGGGNFGGAGASGTWDAPAVNHNAAPQFFDAPILPVVDNAGMANDGATGHSNAGAMDWQLFDGATVHPASPAYDAPIADTGRPDAVTTTDFNSVDTQSPATTDTLSGADAPVRDQWAEDAARATDEPAPTSGAQSNDADTSDASIHAS